MYTSIKYTAHEKSETYVPLPRAFESTNERVC